MEQVANKYSVISASAGQAPVRRFTAIALSFVAMSAFLAGWLPLRMSIATVFLFAGPHNWIEFRYFLSRTPVRLGPFRGYFIVAAAGVIALAALQIGLPLLASSLRSTGAGWSGLIAGWNGLLIAWVVALVYMRSRQVPRFDWRAALAVGAALLAADVLAPALWSLGLVYLHPLLALWFLHRQLRRTRPEWMGAYRACLAAIPFLLVLLWVKLAGGSALAADNGLALRITLHAGAGLLPGLNSGALVATHAFLETIHYGIWILALPLLGLQNPPWRVGAIPLVRNRLGWPRLVKGLLVLGGFAVVALWACFLLNYSTTRDVYFSLAIVHVLVEVPFLIRMA